MLSFIIPKPTTWQAFEEIVADVFARKFQCLNMQRYGRQGQTQYGVDVVGRTQNGIVGVQCKHYPNRIILKTEIDDEVTKSERFVPGLTECYIATSCDADTHVHGHTLTICDSRLRKGQYLVYIMFWPDICGWLSEYPDLLYKHFLRSFPAYELDRLTLPVLDARLRATVTWPTTLDNLKQAAAMTLGSIPQVSDYNLTLGLTTFPDVSFTGKADLEVSLTEHFVIGADPLHSFTASVSQLKSVRSVISGVGFSKLLTIHPNTRLTIAFLTGWLFRRVMGYQLHLVYHDQVWPTVGLRTVSSNLTDGLPHVLNLDSNEVAIVLSITRDIGGSVLTAVQGWAPAPKAVFNYRLEGHSVNSPAHAIAIAEDIARRIKNLFDHWNVTHIHLFGALPAALAVMIGHNLNGINAISLYFLDEDRQTYSVGGTLNNNL